MSDDPERAAGGGVAFFDLDLTLLDVNTASLWIKRERREGNISLSFFAKSAAWVSLYQLGFAKMEDVIEKAMQHAAGLDEAETAERTRRFFDEEVRHRFRPGGLKVVEEHKARGDRCVLLTSSSPYLSAPVSELLELDGVLCNRFEVESGRFTGRAERPLCYGEGKVTHARRWLDEHGLRMEDSAFYTDSFSDLPMLEAAARPVCVHPDPRLGRLADKRGWQVADWGRSS